MFEATVIIQIILMSFALAMDAFSVSVAKGACYGKKSIKLMLLCGLFFGIFQGLMSLIGYLSGSLFIKYIETIDHWIAFVLLVFLGIKMIIEANKKEKEECCPMFPSLKMMFLLAIATSIDALAAGVSLTILFQLEAIISIISITLVTFLLSFIGVRLGNIVGNKFNKSSEIIGGIILILIGIKILIEHLFF
ncbi:MAG: manganese efflux pump MntP family protein [Bacillales bacterium]|jgi:putative Mn2+ efflux pump MntP|nr:manganese efflux pump MntP family protein [Bacillales bacterium]